MNREFAILRPNGLILNHSQRFADVLGLSVISVKEMQIKICYELIDILIKNENINGLKWTDL